MSLPKPLIYLPEEQQRAIEDIRQLLLKRIKRAVPQAMTPGKVRLKIHPSRREPGDEPVRSLKTGKILKGGKGAKRWIVVRRDWQGLRREVSRLVETITASGFDKGVIDREVDRFMFGHYARVRHVVAMAVRDAGEYAERQANQISWYKMEERIRWAKQKNRPDLLSATERRFLLSPNSKYSSEAAMSWALNRRAKIVPRNVRGLPAPRMAEEIAAVAAGKHKAVMGAKGGQLNLSRALHGKAFAEAQEVKSIIFRAISEAKGVDAAGRELVDFMERIGKPISANAADWSRRWNRDGQRYIDKLVAAGRKAAKQGGKRAQKTLLSQIEKIERYALKMIEGRDFGSLKRGEIHQIWQLESGLVEVVQDARKWVARGLPEGGLEKLVDKFVYRRQRSHAERIIRTETHAAYRIRQAELGKDRKWVKYIWRLAGSHAAYQRKVWNQKASRRGAACLCDQLAGQTYTADQVKTKWSHGAHPNCACWFEEVIDHERMLMEPITASEEIWLGEYADEVGLQAA
ncbi:MAG: hypothetical protein ACYTGB_20685 [Planctomycetota bacterium]|jgi:hypothetical protein